MGTNGAFGGSGAATWDRVRDEWTAVSDTGRTSGTGTSSDDVSQNAVEPDARFDSLASAIAQALTREDPDARAASVPVFTFSATLPRRGGGRGGGSAASAANGGASAGNRRITAQAARGGNAIGAASAYRDRDANALAGYGLTLAELDALSPRMRCARILDVAIGQAGHPDEQAMRQASLEQIKALLAGPEAPLLTGLQAIRNFIGELIVRLGLNELRDQIVAKTVNAKQAHRLESGLRQWVRAKVSRLDVGQYGTVSTREFHQVARQMSADVLRLLRGE